MVIKFQFHLFKTTDYDVFRSSEKKITEVTIRADFTASPELSIILRIMQAVAHYIFEVYTFGFRE